jgi:hypothetical protein
MMASPFADLYFPSLLDSAGSDEGEQALAGAGSGSELVDAESDEGSTPYTVAGARDKRKRLELRRVTSKRYRDTLGTLYSELETLVPSVFPNARPRTKSQIIQVTGDAIRKLKHEVSALEAQYVLSCSSNRLKWTEKIVQSYPSFPDISSLFMQLMVHAGWTYAEMWSKSDIVSRSNTADLVQLGRPHQDSTLKDADRSQVQYELRTISSFYEDRPWAMPATLADVVAAARQSPAQVGDSSVVGYVTSTLCSKCSLLQELQNPPLSPHLSSAVRAGLKICYAVPLLVHGEVATIVVLFGEEYSESMKSMLTVAEDMAAAIGNCYGALRKDGIERQTWNIPTSTSVVAVPSSIISGDTVELSPVGIAVTDPQSGMPQASFMQHNLTA